MRHIARRVSQSPPHPHQPTRQLPQRDEHGPTDAQREERDHPRYTETNIVEHDPAFREFLLYLPALQLSYDVFGPMFHLGQDKWTCKFRADEGMSLNWHLDGRIGFPEIVGRCPLHTLRFGYFMSDITHDDSGTLEEIRSNSRCGGGRAAAIAGGSAAKPTPQPQ